MNKIIFSLLLFISLSSFANEETFIQAQTAYNQNNFTNAIQLYESLISKGLINKEVDYNLANAYFKSGNLPEAILHYRKAWYQSPRDPDIIANLQFALRATSAVEPHQNIFEKLLQSFSITEWIQIGIYAYLTFISLLILAYLITPAKPLFFKLSLIPAIIILLSCAGWYKWHQLKQNPEWVVIKSDATTYFGPIQGSTAHYKIPLGALVKQQTTNSKGWIKIKYDEKTGWIEEKYIKRIYP